LPTAKMRTMQANPDRERLLVEGGRMWASPAAGRWFSVVSEGIAASHPISPQVNHQKGGQYLRPSPRLSPSMRRSCNLLRLELLDLLEPVGSNQVTLRRPEVTTYRCFLPDLTGFVGLCRAGPGLQRHFSPAVSRSSEPQEGFRSRYSGLRVQGTASSPSSTTATIIT
jgi:hypothetical protein